MLIGEGARIGFCDMKAVFRKSGVFSIGSGSAKGAEAETVSIRKALTESLLTHRDLLNAKDIVLHVSGGNDMTIQCGMDAMEVMKSYGVTAKPDLLGITLNKSFAPDEIHVTLIALSIAKWGNSEASEK